MRASSCPSLADVGQKVTVGISADACCCNYGSDTSGRHMWHCRCGMNQSSLYEMKQSIVNVVSDYVELDAEERVEVNISMDVALGTVYSVAMPVKRVKPQARLPSPQDEEDTSTDGITMEWDMDDEDADPSGRFPYGC